RREQHRAAAPQHLAEPVDVERLDVRDHRGRARRADIRLVVGVPDHRADLGTRVGEEARRAERELAVAADDGDWSLDTHAPVLPASGARGHNSDTTRWRSGP